MIERAIAGGSTVRLGRRRHRLRHRRYRDDAATWRAKATCSATSADHPFRSWGKEQRVSGTAEAIARELPDTAWTRLSAGDGTKGARLHDWHYLPLADLDAGECDGPPGPWTRGLLIRRHVADGSMAFFSTWCPLGTASSRPWSAVEGPALGDRGRLRNRQERARPRPQ